MEREYGVRLFEGENIHLPRAGLLILSILLLILANFRVGVRVTVGDVTPPGVFSIGELQGCVARAEAVAGEILGGSVNLRGKYRVSLALTAGQYSGAVNMLESALLESAPGIARACAVRADGEFLGYILEPSELGELISDMLSEASTVNTVSASLAQKVTAEYVYVRSDTHVDIMQVSRSLREIAAIEVYAPEASHEGAGAEYTEDGLLIRG